MFRDRDATSFCVQQTFRFSEVTSLDVQLSKLRSVSSLHTNIAASGSTTRNEMLGLNNEHEHLLTFKGLVTLQNKPKQQNNQEIVKVHSHNKHLWLRF